MNNLTTFEIDRDEYGEIRVSQRFNGKIERSTNAPTELHAEKIRTEWVDEFWGINKQPLINQLTLL